MNAQQIAQRAAELVNGDRETTHGTKAINFNNIAEYWNAFLLMKEGREGYVELTGADVAKMMTLLKMARMHSGAFNLDDFIDAAGYAAIAGELSAPRGGEGE